jgi:hypothetical protein
MRPATLMSDSSCRVSSATVDANNEIELVASNGRARTVSCRASVYTSCSVASGVWRQVAWALNFATHAQLKMMRLRGFQVCVGLQSLRLPALVLCEILANAFAPLESLIAFHRVWAIVTTIKHFSRKSKI